MVEALIKKWEMYIWFDEVAKEVRITELGDEFFFAPEKFHRLPFAELTLVYNTLVAREQAAAVICEKN
ncbi:MAG: hypothetical protein Hyperionvirus1_106 [Hyperionvirus sp.]|uniref:Uncharacterized protein n=1 Tax=Hyperionvirus sp. TaxID=2487770 RepID=A0A3G5A5L8_9VIRU|nr:MAG: hypothetical protein Hyperionvirus1_106 [Hyperionvirus sp.]